MEQAETGALRGLGQEDLARIEPKQVEAIPDTMIVTLIGEGGFVPNWESVVDQQVDFEMDVGTILGNALMGIAGMPHDGDRFARFDAVINLQIGANFAEVGVER